MLPRTSIVGQVTHMKIFDKAWRRAAIFLPLVLIFGVLSFFPERFHASTSLTPTDPETLGLSGTLGQLGAINSVFGKQADVEIALRVGTSRSTREKVIADLDLENRLDEPDLDLHRWLERKVTVRSLRGGIILIEMEDRDADLARDIVGAYAAATRERLSEITIRQTKYKREVLETLVEEAGERLVSAEAAYNDFRLKHGYANPTVSVESIAVRIPALQQAVRDKQTAIDTARRVYTDNHITVIQLKAERDALQAQLNQALAADSRSNSGSVGEAVGVTAELFRLERELGMARSLHSSYLNYLDGTMLEDLTSAANIRILEDAHIETSRQIWLPAAALTVLFILIWAAMEFYRLRPPVGSRFDRARRVEMVESPAE